MYRECRHVHASGSRCTSPALGNKGLWCYYHARFHRLQDRQRVALNRHARRLADGRFAPAAATAQSAHHPHHPRPHVPGAGRAGAPGPAGTASALALIPPPAAEPDHTQALPTRSLPTQTIDCGLYPVPDPPLSPALEPAPDTLPLALPLVEDHASLQLALIQVMQALAQNQIDTKRASLLLYSLQIATQNVQCKHASFSSVRSVTYTENGAALARERSSYDIEDMEDKEDEN